MVWRYEILIHLVHQVQFVYQVQVSVTDTLYSSTQASSLVTQVYCSPVVL